MQVFQFLVLAGHLINVGIFSKLIIMNTYNFDFNLTVLPTTKDGESLVHNQLAIAMEIGRRLSIARVVISCIALLISLVGTILIFITAFREKRLWSFTNIILINMCIASLLFTIISLFSGVTNLTPSGLWPYGPAMCKLFSVFSQMSVTAVAYSVVCVSYIRFRVICQPFKTPPSPMTAYITVCALWILSIPLSTVFGVFTQVYAIPFGSVTYPFCLRQYNNQPLTQMQGLSPDIWKVLTWLIFGVNVAIPLVLILYFTCSIHRELNLQSATVVNINKQADKINAIKKDVKIMNLIISLAFFLTWTPIVILYIISEYNVFAQRQTDTPADSVQRYNIYRGLNFLFITLCNCYGAITIFICYKFNPHFNAAFRRVLFRLCKARPNKIRPQLRMSLAGVAGSKSTNNTSVLYNKYNL